MKWTRTNVRALASGQTPMICRELHRRLAVAKARSHEEARARAAENKARRKQRLERAWKLASHTAGQWLALVEACGGICLNCGLPPVLEQSDLTRDHILPISLGGTDAIENIQPLCHQCNSVKGTRSDADLRPADWRQRMPA